MEDTQGRARKSAPSDGDTYRELDFDTAMERLEQRLASKPDELDDLPENTSQTHADEEPEDDDLDDIEEAVEANTPDYDDDDDLDDDTSLEPTEVIEKPKQTEKAQKTKAPEKNTDRAKESQGQDPDERPLSRKERGKIIEELRDQLREEQRQNAALLAQQQSMEEESKTLDKEVERALGSNEEYERVMEAALSGDEDAQELARKWKNNRAFYGKLVGKAKKDTVNEFMDNYWAFIKDLPGITTDTVQKAPNLGTLLQNIYQAGSGMKPQHSDATYEELETKYETLRARYKALKTQKGGQKRSPVTSGGAPVEDVPFNWRAEYLDENDLFTDEADKIVQQYGFEALRSGKYSKKKKR